MSAARLRVLVATDAFPPVCGGSGWSTYEVARGLRARGHAVTVVKPERNATTTTGTAYDGFEPRLFPFAAPDLPYVRNYFKNERLTRALGRALADLMRTERADIVHAQHVLTTPPAIGAAHERGIPVVCTVRDYWPVCYWSDLILTPESDALCPGCSAARMTRCIRPRAGAAWPLALPMIPYMRANLSRKRHTLAAADAIVAVSSTIAGDLRERAPELARTPVQVIPNPVDVRATRRAVAGSLPPMPGEYALFVGKLELNKGANRLLPAMACAPRALPLVVVGDGALRGRMQREADAGGREIRFTGWLDRDDVLRWLAHAALLVFPSHGPESLSRVLLEAGTLGVAMAAMDTGGTRDIITDEVSGLLSRTPSELAQDVGRLAADPTLRARLGAAAQRHVEATFDSSVVLDRLESLYYDLLARRRAAAPPAATQTSRSSPTSRR